MCKYPPIWILGTLRVVKRLYRWFEIKRNGVDEYSSIGDIEIKKAGVSIVRILLRGSRGLVTRAIRKVSIVIIHQNSN